MHKVLDVSIYVKTNENRLIHTKKYTQRVLHRKKKIASYPLVRIQMNNDSEFVKCLIR